MHEVKFMDKSIHEKLATIESLLVTLNEKIDNFLGLETLSPSEKKKIDVIRSEVEAGDVETLEDVFGA